MNNNLRPTRIVVDPTCGMSLSIEDVRHSYEYEGMEYYFCSEKCKTDFIDDPDKYVAKIDKN